MVSVFHVPSHCDVTPLPSYTDVFSDHLLRANNSVPIIRIVYQQTWPSIFFLVCLLLLALIKLNAFSKVVKIIQSTFSLQILNQLEREELNPFRFYAMGLSFFAILNLSFLLYKINSLYNLILSQSSSLSQFLFFFVIVVLILGFKIIVNALIGFFTGEQKILSDYLNNSLLVNQTFGLLMFPFIILMELSPFNPLVFVSAACIILASSTLLKWYRGVIMGLVDERIGFLQIFCYFCSLEILPVFVLVKYIIETF